MGQDLAEHIRKGFEAIIEREENIVLLEIKANIESIYQLTGNFEFSDEALVEIYKECLDNVVSAIDDFLENQRKTLEETQKDIQMILSPESQKALASFVKVMESAADDLADDLADDVE